MDTTTKEQEIAELTAIVEQKKKRNKHWKMLLAQSKKVQRRVAEWKDKKSEDHESILETL